MARAVAALLLVFLPWVAARGDAPAEGVAWTSELGKALAAARGSRRPVFIAINNVIAEGEGVEVASKLLREEVYPDSRIVALSKSFVCVLLRSPIGTADGGELRERFEIEGMIVTPQHLLLHADGRLIQRKEYWSFRDREASVEALSAMMTRALKAHEVRTALPPFGTDAAARSAWIGAAVELVRTGADVELRRAAARELAATDDRGDCLGALQAVLVPGKDPSKEEVPLHVEVVRLLGRPGVEAGLPGLVAMLDAKDAGLRSNAAVSLEYVGSPKVKDALLARLAKERDEVVRSNLLRAAGRCGARDPAARKALLKAASARSDLVAASAMVGLAYFERDADVARALERTLKGSGQDLRRVATLWALAEVGDAKTAEVLGALLAETSETLPSHRLLGAAVASLSGQGNRRAELDQALRWALYEPTRSDTSRTGRGGASFVPKGDTPSAPD